MQTVMEVVAMIGMLLFFSTVIMASIAKEAKKENPKVYAQAKRVVAWTGTLTVICLIAVFVRMVSRLFGWG